MYGQHTDYLHAMRVICINFAADWSNRIQGRDKCLDDIRFLVTVL